MINWILSGISIIGAVFCAFKSKWGWYIWVVVNLGWIIFKFIEHDYAQVIMWITYTGICILGIHQWKKEK